MEKFLNDMLENAAELCDEQEFSEAIKIYDKILDKHPENIAALIDKATTLVGVSTSTTYRNQHV